MICRWLPACEIMCAQAAGPQLHINSGLMGKLGKSHMLLPFYPCYSTVLPLQLGQVHTQSAWVAHACTCSAYPCRCFCTQLFRVHTRSAWLRIPLRLPVALAIYFFAVAFPFYGSLNSIIGAVASPFIAFMFPW